MKEACPFCNIEEDNRQEIVLENDYCLFLQEPQEVLIGSGIIIPKHHRETVFDLTRNEWKATFVLLKQAKKLLDERHDPDGYNVGWNAEETAGQEVFHAHLHVIPRYDAEPLAGKGIRYWIKQDLNKRK
ncbi:MAG: HIT domain-containing protein [Balneolaceae bacterium]|nr:HIT domain-containing protein [Balneolaceae bacterium]